MVFDGIFSYVQVFLYSSVQVEKALRNELWALSTFNNDLANKQTSKNSKKPNEENTNSKSQKFVI